MVLSLAATVLIIIAWVNSEIEYPDVKYCPVVKPCYTSLLYDVQYRCALDIVCPIGYKCCRSDCYIHKVCVVAVNKNGDKIPPPTIVTDDPITTSIPAETDITSAKENDITSQGPVGSELTSGVSALTNTTSLNETTEASITVTFVDNTTSTATITSTIIIEPTESEEFQRVTIQATTIDGDTTISNEESFSTLQIARGTEKLSSISDSIGAESSEIFSTKDYTTTLGETVQSTTKEGDTTAFNDEIYSIVTGTEKLLSISDSIDTESSEIFTTENYTTLHETVQATTKEGDTTAFNDKIYSIVTGTEKLLSISDSIDTESSEIFTTENYTTTLHETVQATTKEGDTTAFNDEIYSIVTGTEKLLSISDSIDTESSEIFTTENYTATLHETVQATTKEGGTTDFNEEIYSTANTEIETETENISTKTSTLYIEVSTREDHTTIMAGTIDTTSTTNLELAYSTSTDETSTLTLYKNSTEHTVTENNSVNDVSTVTTENESTSSIVTSSDEDVTAVDGSGNLYIDIDEEYDVEGSGGTIVISEDDEIVFPSDDELTTIRINHEHTTARKSDENEDFEIELFSTTDQTTNFELPETVATLTTVSSYVSTMNEITKKEQGTVATTIDNTSDFEGSGNNVSDTTAHTSSVTQTSFSQAIADDEDYYTEGSGDTTNSAVTENDDDDIIFPDSYRITSTKKVNDRWTTLKSSEDFELELSKGTEEANLNLESSVEEYNGITLLGTTTEKPQNNIQTKINQEVGSVTGTTSISIDKGGIIHDTVAKEATTANEQLTPGSPENDLIDNEPDDIEDELTTYSPIAEVYSHRKNILQKETPLSNITTKTLNSLVVNREEEEEDEDDEDGVDDDIRNNFQMRITSG
ncbi:hypothetical protein FQA39_LY17149 [Lamprigera yunnana]|nr:hypothetical protein FQA39_LY17149 [Lamprigera yunnana]